MATWAATHVSVTTDITHFLPEDAGARELSGLMEVVSGSALARTLILSVQAPSAQVAAAAARDLAARLEGHPEVASVRGAVDDAAQKAVWDLYFPRRLFFLDADRRDLSDAGLARAAADLKRQLALPTGALVRRLAPEDPLLAFPARMQALQGLQGDRLRPVDGQLVTRDGHHGVVFVTSRRSAFDTEASAALIDAVDAAFEQVRAAHGDDLVLETSGAHRFALQGERSVKADVTRISVVSILGALALFLVFFRSVRPVVLTLVPVVVGVLAAVCVSAAVFGPLHGLTLAFGASLIGVCLDYGVHLVNHHWLGGGVDGWTSLRRVGPGLLLGCLTTVAGLAGLAWTSAPGIREIAVFSSVGVLAALACAAAVVPEWLQPRPAPVPIQARAAAGLGRLLAHLRGRRVPLLVVIAVAGCVTAVGQPRLQWVDDVRALNHLDPALLAEDERVRARVARVEAGQLVVAVGADEQEALARNDAAAERLAGAAHAGEVGGVRSLHSLLWSEARQRESAAAVAAAPDLPARLARALAAEGFRPEAFGDLAAALTPSAPPLTWADLAASPLGPVVAPMRAALGGKVGILTLLHDVRDPDALRARLSGLEGVHYYDHTALLAGAYGQFRRRTLELVGVGLLAVLALVALRYRDARLTLAAVLPAVLAALTTVGLLGLLGVQANLLNLAALLLVLSIGVDYGVFVVEQRRDPEGLRAALLSIVMACATTVLSFGLLAMSASPALRALGLTIGLGVLLSLLLAPTAFVLLVDDGPDPE